jgi:hypothetical protein
MAAFRIYERDEAGRVYSTELDSEKKLVCLISNISNRSHVQIVHPMLASYYAECFEFRLHVRRPC